MKILIVNPRFFVYGGAERQIVQLANYLTEANHSVTLLTEGVLPEMHRDLVETRIICTENLQNLQNTYQTIMHKFDVLNPHNHPVELLHYPKHAKVVWTCNEPPIEVLKGEKVDPVQKEVVQKYIDAYCVIDEYNARRFESLYGVDAIVNYPGVRYDLFAQARSCNTALQERFGLKDKFMILQAGYITWTKNQVESVRILAQVKKTIPNAKLVLAGWDQDPYVNDVRSVAHELGVSDDVVITGYLRSDNELVDLYQLADVYVSPILEQGGWANSFEAVCAGVPTIVSDRQTCAHLFREHDLGVVLPVEEFANEIITICEEKYNPEGVLITPHGLGVEWIRDNLSWRAYGERYERIFNEVIE